MASQTRHIKIIHGIEPLFIVDGFKFTQPECSHYFLTHYHSDHTVGLTPRFDKGKIYCSYGTKQLLVNDMGMNENLIQILRVNETLVVEGVEVTALDANHCPAAIMLHFFCPKSVRSVLHVGDFRADECVVNDKSLTRLLYRHGGLDTLYLDTTYCKHTHTFPSQKVVLQSIAKIVTTELKADPNTLFVVGAYALGKERAVASIVKASGSRALVSERRAMMLECVGLYDPELYCTAVSLMPGEHCCVYVVTGGSDHESLANTVAQAAKSINQQRAKSHPLQNPFTNAVGFRISGWTYTKSQALKGYIPWVQRHILKITSNNPPCGAGFHSDCQSEHTTAAIDVELEVGSTMDNGRKGQGKGVRPVKRCGKKSGAKAVAGGGGGKGKVKGKGKGKGNGMRQRRNMGERGKSRAQGLSMVLGPIIGRTYGGTGNAVVESTSPPQAPAPPTPPSQPPSAAASSPQFPASAASSSHLFSSPPFSSFFCYCSSTSSTTTGDVAVRCCHHHHHRHRNHHPDTTFRNWFAPGGGGGEGESGGIGGGGEGACTTCYSRSGRIRESAAGVNDADAVDEKSACANSSSDRGSSSGCSSSYCRSGDGSCSRSARDRGSVTDGTLLPCTHVSEFTTKLYAVPYSGTCFVCACAYACGLGVWVFVCSFYFCMVMCFGVWGSVACSCSGACLCLSVYVPVCSCVCLCACV